MTFKTFQNFVSATKNFLVKEIIAIENAPIKQNREICLKMGVMKNRIDLVQYASLNYPETFKNLNYLLVERNLDLEICKLLINHGFKPFPNKRAVYFFMNNPQLLNFYLEKGHIFEELFGEEPNKKDRLEYLCGSEFEKNLKVSISIQNIEKNNSLGGNLFALTQIIHTYAQKYSNIDYENEMHKVFIITNQEGTDNINQFMEVLIKYNFFKDKFYFKIEPQLNKMAKLIYLNNTDSLFDFLKNKQDEKILKVISITNRGHKNSIL